MKLKDVQDFLKKITPKDSYKDYYDRDFQFKEVMIQGNLQQTLELHFYDDEDQSTNFEGLVPVQNYVRFQGKNYSVKECAIELISFWFYTKEDTKQLVEKIYDLMNTEEMDIFSVNHYYGNFISDDYYLFKKGNVMYSLSLGAND